MNRVLLVWLVLLLPAAVCRAAPVYELHVHCLNGSDAHGTGSFAAPFRSPARARAELHQLRLAQSSPEPVVGVVTIAGVCELAGPLVLDDPQLDSHTTYRAAGPGAMISAGTKLDVPSNWAQLLGNKVSSIDLSHYNFTSENLGRLRGRGYSGGSACIDLNNFEPSAAELFYRPPGTTSMAGVKSSGPAEVGVMRLARYPNVGGAVPSAQDWAQITTVVGSGVGENSSIELAAVTPSQLKGWADAIAQGVDIWAHGLWSWDWADSHKPIKAIDLKSQKITVGIDAINRDVSPIRPATSSQGGHAYIYNSPSELDAPGEYFIDRENATLSFIAPSSPSGSGHACRWNVSISRSDQPGRSWKSLLRALLMTARYGRAHGYLGADKVWGLYEDSFSFSGCSTTGLMGQTCAQMPPPDGPIPAGARTLRSANGTVVGEGVCCNSVIDSVVSAVRIGCDPPPPAPPPGTVGTFHLSRLQSAVELHGVSNVTLSGLEIRYARGAGVVVTDSIGARIEGCTISNHGMMGVNVSNGASCVVADSEIAGNGDGGVVLYGGNRTSLTPSAHAVINCTLHHNQRWIMNYAPNVFLGGVGQSIVDSEIYASPQIGVFFQGNDHTLTGSNLHDLTRQCADCGAFYMGRDWTYRGNAITGTTFSMLDSIWTSGTSAVYLDDQLSSVRIAGNVFDRVTGMVLELGGGRHNEFVNNVVKHSGSVHFDNRGGGGSACCGPSRMPYAFLDRVPYKSAAWAKYPNLAKILDDQPCTPKYNRIENNVLCDGLVSLGLNEAAIRSWGSIIGNNTVVNSC